MDQVLYEIENIKCGYKGTPVLHIESLNILKGKTYFIIGPSGIGKSTFIETMGLMSNTILDNGKGVFKYNSVQATSIDFLTVWNLGEKILSDHRNKLFSFLFQNNYLMENFSVGENMIFTSLMKSSSPELAYEEIIRTMQLIDLDIRFYDRKVSELSGGQKQRVAFVRSITSPSEVLICDEPTGNLDSSTALKLMQTLISEANKKSSTTLVVSHDINLALEFADVIIPIQAKEGINGVRLGVINNNRNLIKSDLTWQSSSGEKIKDILYFVRSNW